METQELLQLEIEKLKLELELKKNEINLLNYFNVPSDNILFISGDDYKRNYDIDMLKDIEHDYRNASYITWSKVYAWFQITYPHIHLDTVKRIDFEKHLISECFLDEHKSGTIYFYFICSKTGKQTRPFSYPVRGSKPGAIINPKATDIEYAVNRGRVKAIAVFTGYGFRLWSGDDFELDKSPMIERILELGKEYRKLTGKDYPEITSVGLGMKLQELKQFGIKLKADLEALIQNK